MSRERAYGTTNIDKKSTRKIFIESIFLMSSLFDINLTENLNLRQVNRILLLLENLRFSGKRYDYTLGLNFLPDGSLGSIDLFQDGRHDSQYYDEMYLGPAFISDFFLVKKNPRILIEPLKT